jgi:hypothetical protein
VLRCACGPHRERPCRRCIRLGRAHLCSDVPPRKRGRRPKHYTYAADASPARQPQPQPSTELLRAGYGAIPEGHYHQHHPDYYYDDGGGEDDDDDDDDDQDSVDQHLQQQQQHRHRAYVDIDIDQHHVNTNANRQKKKKATTTTKRHKKSSGAKPKLKVEPDTTTATTTVTTTIDASPASSSSLSSPPVPTPVPTTTAMAAAGVDGLRRQVELLDGKFELLTQLLNSMAGELKQLRQANEALASAVAHTQTHIRDTDVVVADLLRADRDRLAADEQREAAMAQARAAKKQKKRLKAQQRQRQRIIEEVDSGLSPIASSSSSPASSSSSTTASSGGFPSRTSFSFELSLLQSGVSPAVVLEARRKLPWLCHYDISPNRFALLDFTYVCRYATPLP